MRLPAAFPAIMLVLGFSLPASSQSSSATPLDINIPEACREANLGMPNMAHSLSSSMANMTDAQKAYMQAMAKTQSTTGVMIKDPDVSFVCMMISHDLSAIDMAHVVLRYGKDGETRKMAEDMIAAQEKEIGGLKAWLLHRNGPTPRKP